MASYLVLAAAVVLLIAAYVRLERKVASLAPDFRDVLQRRALRELESQVATFCASNGRASNQRIVAGIVPPSALSATKAARFVATLAEALDAEPILITTSSGLGEQEDLPVTIVVRASRSGPWQGPAIVGLFGGTELLDATHLNRPAGEIMSHFDIFSREFDHGVQ